MTGKRKRSGEEGMDVDEDADAEEAWEDDEDSSDKMDVDESGQSARRKARKSNTGSAVVAATAGLGRTNKSGGRVTARAGAVRVPAKDRQGTGLRDPSQRAKATKLHDLSLRERNRHARAGEADRHITVKNVEWMLKGKRGKGSTRSR